MAVLPGEKYREPRHGFPGSYGFATAGKAKCNSGLPDTAAASEGCVAAILLSGHGTAEEIGKANEEPVSETEDSKLLEHAAGYADCGDAALCQFSGRLVRR